MVKAALIALALAAGLLFGTHTKPVARKPLGSANATAAEVIENTKTIIRKSISFHLVNPRGIAAHLLREMNGKIGLWEWTNERFQ